MTSTLCAFCEKYSHVTPMWASLGNADGRSYLQAAARCDNCGRASLGVAWAYYSVSNTDPKDRFNYTPDAAFQWFPRIGASPEFPDVPAHVARAASEAHAAYSINAFMAAVLMARTVVEATAKEKGVPKGNLLAKIDELASKSIIRNDTKEAAHEIRHLGNDMAHGDISDLPDAEDVADVLALMDEVLNEVFQGPAKTARLRARRSDPRA